jgi:hypothetical protein
LEKRASIDIRNPGKMTPGEIAMLDDINRDRGSKVKRDHILPIIRAGRKNTRQPIRSDLLRIISMLLDAKDRRCRIDKPRLEMKIFLPKFGQTGLLYRLVS